MDFDYTTFLDRLNKEVSKLGINLDGTRLDHVAYQTKSSEEYDSLKPEFEKFAKLIREAIVGGRRVGVFKITRPIIYKRQSIKAIELIEPKQDQKCESGLEHAEYLLPISLEEFIEKYPNVNWNTDAINREEFPMLILRLSDKMQIKFPRHSVLS